MSTEYANKRLRELMRGTTMHVGHDAVMRDVMLEMNDCEGRSASERDITDAYCDAGAVVVRGWDEDVVNGVVVVANVVVVVGG